MRIILLLIICFFCGCGSDDSEKKQIMDCYEKCEVEQLSLKKRNLDLFKKNSNLEQFLNTFFFERDFHNFSLDDSLITFYANDNVFIYSVSREEIWSSRCGLVEKISKEQSNEMNRMMNAYVEKLENLNLKGETWPTLAIWKSRSPNKIKVYDVGYEITSQRVLIEKFFGERVFVHGCKKHILTY